MNQNLSFQHLKFVLIFTGCTILGMSLGTTLVFIVTSLMQNAPPWYTSLTALAISHLSTYLIPALAYWYWFKLAKWKDFNRRPLKSVSVLWIGILAGIIILPFNEILITWNKSIAFPRLFSGIEQWIKQKENAKSLLTATLLHIKSGDQLFIVLIVSGLIASVGEEVFFRGIIQNKLIKGTKNIHAGVWLAAAIFSAVHFQFYGFFPRLVLGLVLGYLYLFSGNIWVPILSHFINNALFVFANFFEHQIFKYSSEIHLKINPWLLGGFSLVVSILLLKYFYGKNRGLLSEANG